MGTNYYYEGSIPCVTCKRYDDSNSVRLHIGKSSSGWVFLLHIIPDSGIRSLKDWQAIWRQGGRIVDEYGNVVSVENMVSKITERSHPGGLRSYHGIKEPSEATYEVSEVKFS